MMASNRDELTASIPMIIDGKRVSARSTFSVINPATGAAFADVAAGDISHLEAAVAAARNAFPTWSGTADTERQRLLHAIGDALRTNMPALMELVTRESGKPLKGLNGVGAGMEVGGAIAWTHATADLTLPVEIIQDNEEARIEVHCHLACHSCLTRWQHRRDQTFRVDPGRNRQIR